MALRKNQYIFQQIILNWCGSQLQFPLQILKIFWWLQYPNQTKSREHDDSNSYTKCMSLSAIWYSFLNLRLRNSYHRNMSMDSFFSKQHKTLEEDMSESKRTLSQLLNHLHCHLDCLVDCVFEHYTCLQPGNKCKRHKANIYIHT